jgi:DNA-binding NarL/FixJ family response regulator
MSRVLLADSDSNTRSALALLLNRKLGITDICEASDGSALAEQLKVFKIDLLILDWALPDRPDLQTYRTQPETTSSLQIVILSVNANDKGVAEALGSVFIHKATPADQVLTQLAGLLKVAPSNAQP